MAVIERNDVQHLQMLPLVLVNTLHQHVENRVRIDDYAGALQGEGGEFPLVVLLDLAPPGAKLRVLSQWFQALELGQVLDPVRSDMLGDQIREPRIGKHHPAPRRNAVGLVAELLRPHFVEVLQDIALQQLRMKLRDAVDGVAADAGEVRHAHVTLSALVDQRHAGDPRIVAEEANAHLLEELRVDFLDDLQMPRQHAAEYLQRPALQRLGQQRVVGVGEGTARDGPRLAPWQQRLIDQQAHQFGDGDRRMRIVELHRKFLVKLVDRQLLRPQYAHHVLQGTGHEEILLLEPQLLAAQLLVVRIEHLADVLRGRPFWLTAP